MSIKGILYTALLTLILAPAMAQGDNDWRYERHEHDWREFSEDEARGVVIRNEEFGYPMCLDANMDHGIGNGSPVYVYRCHGRENQRWNIVKRDGWEHGAGIVGIGGMCLDVRGASDRTGAPTQLWSCHFHDNQRFHIGRDGRIHDMQNPGKCLTAIDNRDRSPVVIADCHRAPGQIWRVEH